MLKIKTIVSPVFDRDLEFGIKHPDVKRLQQLLNLDPDTLVAANGPGSLQNETDYYGSHAQDAVLRFQLKHELIRAKTDQGSGRFGPKTRAKFSEVYEFSSQVEPKPLVSNSNGVELTAARLCAIILTLPPAKAESFVEPLNAAMKEFLINTPARICAFLAQIAHETGGFRWLRELGNDDYFKKYEGRKDLGNAEPGDGPRFRGRGLIQITGRTNYISAGAALKIDLLSNPAMAESVEIAARAAAWFWSSRKLNELADKGDFEMITRRINGGLNGLQDRLAYWVRAKKEFGLG